MLFAVAVLVPTPKTRPRVVYGGAGEPSSPVGRKGSRRLLSSLPASELSDLLVRSGGSSSQAQATSAKIVRYVFGSATSSGAMEPVWDEAALHAIGVGAWAFEALLALSPTVSLAIAERAPAQDGAERLLLRAMDGALIETVILPAAGRTTVCLSSQVGCARACTFCETGSLGLTRQLDAGEIVDQVRIARALWGNKSPAIMNVVFMGMGEPFDNLREVARATHVLTDDRGLKFSPSRVTVSTVGVADKIETFYATCRAELAVSLNSIDDEARTRIMPINARFNLGVLRAALERSVPKSHKVLFEYVLIADFNDSLGHADRLASWVSTIPCRVNVIPLNPGPDPSLRSPSPEAVSAFVARLSQHGVTTLVRRPRGREVGGACGQLAGARRNTWPS